jgi:hypothetical protein
MKQHGATHLALPTANDTTAAIYTQCLSVLPHELAKHTDIGTKMDVLLSLSLIFRGMGLAHQLVERYGDRVMTGPFAGLRLFPQGIHPMAAPLLSGLYEYELHGAVESLLCTPYDTIINIGCADGYYAVGMALRCPTARIIAADIEPEMQQRTRQLAAYNGIEDRITLHGEVTAAGLQALATGRTLILCDIEGAEDDLLNPANVPALCQCDMLVEQHEVFRPGISERLRMRFTTTHTIEMIEPGGVAPPIPPTLQGLTELERTLLTFTGRQGHTPWGVYLVNA